MKFEMDATIDGLTMAVIEWRCPSCKCQMTVDVEGWPTVLVNGNEPMVEPNYCPNCGYGTDGENR